MVATAQLLTGYNKNHAQGTSITIPTTLGGSTGDLASQQKQVDIVGGGTLHLKKDARSRDFLPNVRGKNWNM